MGKVISLAEIDASLMWNVTLPPDGVTLVQGKETKNRSMERFIGKEAFPYAVQYLKGEPLINMHASIVDVASLEQCRDDPKCTWIWGTSKLLAGAEVKITDVLGQFNASIAGTRCHVTSQKNYAGCHRPDPSLKLTRGEAYLLEAVPIAYPDQPALPFTLMCHYRPADLINEATGKYDRWCHGISGNEFVVVPATGFDEMQVRVGDVVV